MAFCLKCGASYEEGTRFCEHCGAPIGNAEPEVRPEPVADTYGSMDYKSEDQSYSRRDQSFGANDYSQYNNDPYSPMIDNGFKPKAATNGMCLAGFIVSLVNLILCGIVSPISLILSIIGLASASKNGQAGKGLAIAGIVISSIFVVIGIISIIIIIATGGEGFSYHYSWTP